MPMCTQRGCACVQGRLVCGYVCTDVCVYVCMYVCMYVSTRVPCRMAMTQEATSNESTDACTSAGRFHLAIVSAAASSGVGSFASDRRLSAGV